MRSSFQESFSPMRRSQRDEVLCIATTPNVFLDNSPGFRSCLQITIHLFRCIKQISWVMEHDLKALQREREREKEEGRYKTSQINRICSILLKKGSSVSLGKEDSKIHVFFGYYLHWSVSSFLSQEGSQGISWEFHQGGVPELIARWIWKFCRKLKAGCKWQVLEFHV